MMIHSSSGLRWAWPRHSITTRLPVIATVSTGMMVNTGAVKLEGGAKEREREAHGDVVNDAIVTNSREYIELC